MSIEDLAKLANINPEYRHYLGLVPQDVYDRVLENPDKFHKYIDNLKEYYVSMTGDTEGLDAFITKSFDLEQLQ